LAPQPSLGLGLLRNLLPLKMAEFLGGFSTIFYRVGLLAPRPTPTLEDLYPPEAGWPSYTPRHWVPILVASYGTHGLRWDYSYSPVTTREILTVPSHVISFFFSPFRGSIPDRGNDDN
jgi:hypothetical protein